MRLSLRGAGRLFRCLVLGAAMSQGLPAWAERPADEVARLLEQGQLEQAAQKADSYLKQQPGDVELRFLRGVIATEQKQNAQAIRIFTALTRDYPHLPEPYNNLAVLYAADGQERKAAEMLEQAIRTSPSYTTAYENLGDLYARMASEAYSKALQLDESRQTLKPKLALIRQIVPAGAAGAGRVATAAAAPASPAASRPAVVVRPAEPAPTVVARAPEAPAAAVPAAPAPAAEAASRAVPAPAAVAAAPASQAADEAAPSAEVEQAVRAWAAAWSAQDMKRYLDAYSNSFMPADGSSLAAWREQRRQRIVGKNRIEVTVRNLNIAVQGSEATAKFRQHYSAGKLVTTTRKTLTLRQEDGQWRIVREVVGG